jgi:tRNA(Ile)-lysidine synthase
MLRELEQKTAVFLNAEQLIRPGEKVLLAVSGGTDSTALLHIFAALRLDSCCAHINHQLRGDEAQRDEDFVIGQCRKLNIPLTVETIYVKRYAWMNKLSIETAARDIRILKLLQIAKRQNCTCIATAHHKNDNAETIIHRLLRGTGFRGLCGIWPTKDFGDGIRYIRPMLRVTRNEIIQYLNESKLKWCEDRTNRDPVYKRNFIRHYLLAQLQKDSSSSLVDELSELAEKSRGFHKLVCSKADTIWPDVVSFKRHIPALDLARLAPHHLEVKIEIIRRIIAELDCGERDFTEEHYEKILNLSINKTIQLPSISTFWEDGKINFIRFRSKSQECRAQLPSPIQLNIPGKTEFASAVIETEVFEYDAAALENFKKTKDNNVEWFDFEKLKLPLEVRPRKTGDKFWSLGLAGEKKVGKFLTTAKVSQSVRRRLLVIADSEKIVWLCPVRISEQAKVIESTRKVIQIKISDSGG